MGVRHGAHGANQRLTSPKRGHRPLVKDERRVADAELGTQVRRLPADGQIGDVADQGRHRR
jgi:hypothetical protein